MEPGEVGTAVRLLSSAELIAVLRRRGIELPGSGMAETSGGTGTAGISAGKPSGAGEPQTFYVDLCRAHGLHSVSAAELRAARADGAADAAAGGFGGGGGVGGGGVGVGGSADAFVALLRSIARSGSAQVVLGVEALVLEPHAVGGKYRIKVEPAGLVEGASVLHTGAPTKTTGAKITPAETAHANPPVRTARPHRPPVRAASRTSHTVPPTPLSGVCDGDGRSRSLASHAPHFPPTPLRVRNGPGRSRPLRLEAFDRRPFREQGVGSAG